MQKVCNVLGVLGFVMSGTLVGLSVAAFVRIPGMIEDYAASMMDDITGNVTEMLMVRSTTSCQSCQPALDRLCRLNFHERSGQLAIALHEMPS